MTKLPGVEASTTVMWERERERGRLGGVGGENERVSEREGERACDGKGK